MGQVSGLALEVHVLAHFHARIGDSMADKHRSHGFASTVRAGLGIPPGLSSPQAHTRKECEHEISMIGVPFKVTAACERRDLQRLQAHNLELQRQRRAQTGC